jgi:hypothetical protein
MSDKDPEEPIEPEEEGTDDAVPPVGGNPPKG